MACTDVNPRDLIVLVQGDGPLWHTQQNWLCAQSRKDHVDGTHAYFSGEQH